MPSALDRDEGLRDEPLVLAERPQRRLLAGLVTVEGEDHLAAELVRVHQQPAQHVDVLDAERRAAGRDRGRDAGQVAGHHVGVALDDDRLPPPGDLPLGQVDAVEHLALLVERRLRGVEVLRAVVVVEQLAGAEADHVAGDVPDRPEQPAAEPVDQRAAGAAAGPARRSPARVWLKPLPRRCLVSASQPTGRVAAAEVRRRLAVEAALGEELPGGLRLGRGAAARRRTRRRPCCASTSRARCAAAWRGGAAPPLSYRSWIPTWSASRSTASTKDELLDPAGRSR